MDDGWFATKLGRGGGGETEQNVQAETQETAAAAIPSSLTSIQDF